MSDMSRRREVHQGEEGFPMPHSLPDGSGGFPVVVVTGPPADTTFLLNFFLIPQLHRACPRFWLENNNYAISSCISSYLLNSLWFWIQSENKKSKVKSLAFRVIFITAYQPYQLMLYFSNPWDFWLILLPLLGCVYTSCPFIKFQQH